MQSRLGQDVLLDCGFSGPASPFSVEWRLQHGGAGRVVLAYDGATRKTSVAEKGARLFLDPDTNNVSLQLQGVGVGQEGTYICTVYLPHLRTQQAMELKVVGECGGGRAGGQVVSRWYCPSSTSCWWFPVVCIPASCICKEGFLCKPKMLSPLFPLALYNFLVSITLLHAVPRT